jgi:predicted nucleic acid-binding protein
MKVLLDTNVLASAAVARGLCADVLREVLAEHELVVCPQILTELRRILRTKFGMPHRLIESFVELFQQDTICVQPAELPRVRLKDKGGGASVLVTGDKELQNLGQFSGVRILSPRRFWEELTAR